MANLNEAQMMRSLSELEDMIEKAQIVQGGNSERKSWAGSDWDDQTMPKSTPNGTDYVPPKKVARKALDTMPVEDIERYLEMRKSGAPNPIAAEAEILQTVPGVEKAICPKCEGTQRDLLAKSRCEKCNGFGFVWMVPNHESASMIKSIEAKWNVSKAVSPEHGHNVGGGDDRATTTPKDGDKEEKPETVNSTPNVKKALKKVQKQIKKAMEGEEFVPEKKEFPPAKEDNEEDIAAKDEGDEGAGDDSGADSLEDILEGEKEEKCVNKGLSAKLVGRTLDVLVKSMALFTDRMDAMAGSINDIYEVQREQSDLVNSVAQSVVGVQKSLTGPSDMPRPARAPKAVTQNVQVLQKGFVDSAPGTNDGGPRFDFSTLKKGATKMIINGKLDKHVGLRMDAGEVPEDKIVKSIEAYIDANGVE